MAIVYQHRRKDTNEVFYIGIGENKKRAYVYGRNPHWNRIVNKYGYEVDILVDGCSWEDACQIEIGMIADYGRANLGLGLLANLTNGGDTSPMKDPIVAKKVSDSLKALGDNHPSRRQERREAQREFMRSEKNHMKTQKSKNRQSQLWKENNPMFNEDIIKKVMASQTPIKSNQWKENNPMFKEENKIVAQKRMKENNPNSKKIECPYCKLIGGKINMIRYHFENCKYKK
jgi:hypothetical protein